ncbi:MAG: hypothetical protein KatS3mg111_1125 [Pirellulaceae bacterium]|nr:MAG: hypothetical protein KatS3mg111_1125 [Pirellulaceae bacterium]
MVNRPEECETLSWWSNHLAPAVVGEKDVALPATGTKEADDAQVGELAEGQRAAARPSMREEISAEQGAEARVASDRPDSSMLLSVSRPLMACEFEVLQNQHQYRAGTEAAWEALQRIEQLENLFSVYRPHSELSVLNRFGAQRAVALSYDTRTLLQLAVDLWQITGGAFDITAGALSEAWGFSRRQGKMPSPQDIEQALENVGSQWLEIDAEQSTARFLKAGIQVNPGGIGKGYALDRARAVLLDRGIHDFMLHGGKSSVLAVGHRRHRRTGGGWLVSLNHPFREQEKIGVIRLRNQALGTSGSGKQFFHYQGKRYSHIIDPRTGWPASGLLSTTVICASGAIADALATALFVMGPLHAAEFLRAHQTIGAIVIGGTPNQLHVQTFNLEEGTWMPEPRYRESHSHSSH